MKRLGNKKNKKSCKRSVKRGFTLIELLVSVAVVVVLAGIMWQGLSAFRETQELNLSIETALGFLKNARVKTLASEGAKQYGVHFEEAKVILFEGAVYNSGSTTDSFVLPSLIRISSVVLDGGGQDVVFERITGKTIQPGTIDFEVGRTSRRRTVQILSSGLVDLQ